jgi:EpsI family protein
MTRWLEIAGVGLLAAGVYFAFREPVDAMVNQWSASPMYSHGYTVPFISLWMLLSQREAFARWTPQPARLAALPILGLALVMLIGGELTAVQVVQQLGFVLTVPGIILFLFGTRYLLISAPAVAYLLFMVPFWEAFTESLHQPFQNNSAVLGVGLMKALGVPVHLEGTTITLPNIVLEVARECSGVNYLIAVLALALPLSWIRLQTWTRRIVLIATSLAIAALANGLRVALIGTLAYYDVGSPVHGPFHVLHGLFVAGIGYVVLFAGLRVLEPAPAAVAPGPAELPPVRWRAADACGLAVVFWTIVFVGMAPAATPLALAKPLDLLPMNLESWQADIGRSHQPTQVTAWTGADEELQRRYTNASGTTATVQVWYFGAQRQDREVVSSRVAPLHRGAERRALPLSASDTFAVNRVRFEDRSEVGLFWYEVGGVAEVGEFSTKLKSVWRTLRARRSDAAAVVITAPAAPGTEERVLAELETLAGQLHRQLAEHWPAPGPASASAAAPAENPGD